MQLRNWIVSVAGLLVTAFPFNGQDNAKLVTLTKSQHQRLPLAQDVQRVAVGDPEIISAEPIGSRELLILGKGWGRTSLIVWYLSGEVEERVVLVKRDLSTLEAALHDVHPNIRVDVAPDRDAIVLLGTVPDAGFSQAAESVARNYLNAASTAGQRGARGQQPVPLIANAEPASPGSPVAAETVRLTATAPLTPVGSVINLLRLETLPELLEDRVQRAVQTVGGADIGVRRIQRTQFRDDAKDVFVMDGRIATQVALTRALTLAAQVLTGRTASEDDIRVVADESGALVPRNQNLQTSAGSGGGGGGGGAAGGLFGGGGGSSNQLGRLSNLVGRNIARAKVVEAADGRLLSFLEVRDLPQIRVSIKLYEVNRTKLRTYNPNTALLTSEFQQPSLNPALAAGAVQGGQAPRVGGGGRTTVQNVLAFLGGTLSNQMQFTSPHFAVDQVFTLLERAGIAKSLSSPSITVLSGEQATFQVGGEIPIPEAFAPIFGTGQTGAATGLAAGVFSFVSFRPFGIQLGVRPLIGDDDKITLDVTPQVITPSAELTSQIRESTGTNPLTTAFQNRSMRTSARLDDGQTLIVGGLLTRSTQERQAGPPGLKDAPGLGWLFKSFERADEGLELVLVVNPAIMRDPVPDVPLWQYAGQDELIEEVSKLVRKPGLHDNPNQPSALKENN